MALYNSSEFNCVLAGSICLYASITSIVVPCSIKLNCLVKPSIYEHTCNATRNVDSVIFFSRPLAESTVLLYQI